MKNGNAGQYAGDGQDRHCVCLWHVIGFENESTVFPGEIPHLPGPATHRRNDLQPVNDKNKNRTYIHLNWQRTALAGGHHSLRPRANRRYADFADLIDEAHEGGLCPLTAVCDNISDGSYALDSNRERKCSKCAKCRLFRKKRGRAIEGESTGTFSPACSSLSRYFPFGQCRKLGEKNVRS